MSDTDMVFAKEVADALSTTIGDGATVTSKMFTAGQDGALVQVLPPETLVLGLVVHKQGQDNLQIAIPLGTGANGF